MPPGLNKNVVSGFCEKEPPTLKQIIGAGSNFFVCRKVSTRLASPLVRERDGEGPVTAECLSDAPDLPNRSKWARTRALFLLPVCVVILPLSLSPPCLLRPCPHRACSQNSHLTAIFLLRSKQERCESVVTSPRKTVFRLRLKYSAMHTANPKP